jgi:DnaJ-class molecular chaperone
MAAQQNGRILPGQPNQRQAETFASGRRISLAIKLEKQSMKPIRSNPNEEKCPACNGTGSPPFKQPTPGRRIYSPPCKTCGGKGRLMEEPAE